MAMATLASEVTADAIWLSWTVPADRGGDPISAYDIRYDTVPITEGTWGNATQVTAEPSPQTPGSTQLYEVSGLTTGVQCYFAMKTADAAGNWSELSNVASYVIGQPLPSDAVRPSQNPFRLSQTSEISFSGAPGDLTIATLSGEVVRRWENNSSAEIIWDGRNQSGQAVATGIYLWYANNGAARGKVVLVR
ncbi:MAG: fibronectin type III domain-containing protein [candidate division Zixibacteria bacterium]|nr:fibronectin type III domain-containing protein [candidate division Zixibacteria bacterium]